MEIGRLQRFATDALMAKGGHPFRRAAPTGRRIAVVSPKSHTMSEVVALMTGAAEPGAVGYDQVVKDAERQGAPLSPEALRSTNADG